jgi:hypothetical protein
VRSGITTINDNADSAIYPGNIEAAMAVYGEVGVRVVYARMFFDRMDGRIQGYVDALKARSPKSNCARSWRKRLWPKIGSQPCQISIMARQEVVYQFGPLLPLPRR